MKFKKLLNVINMSQPIKIISINGSVTKHTSVFSLANISDKRSKFDRPLIKSLEGYKVHSLRHVHNNMEIPENQDYIEITLLKGGNDND